MAKGSANSVLRRSPLYVQKQRLIGFATTPNGIITLLYNILIHFPTFTGCFLMLLLCFSCHLSNCYTKNTVFVQPLLRFCASNHACFSFWMYFTQG